MTPPDRPLSSRTRTGSNPLIDPRREPEDVDSTESPPSKPVMTSEDALRILGENPENRGIVLWASALAREQKEANELRKKGLESLETKVSAVDTKVDGVQTSVTDLKASMEGLESRLMAEFGKRAAIDDALARKVAVRQTILVLVTAAGTMFLILWWAGFFQGGPGAALVSGDATATKLGREHPTLTGYATILLSVLVVVGKAAAELKENRVFPKDSIPGKIVQVCAGLGAGAIALLQRQDAPKPPTSPTAQETAPADSNPSEGKTP